MNSKEELKLVVEDDKEEPTQRLGAGAQRALERYLRRIQEENERCGRPMNSETKITRQQIRRARRRNPYWQKWQEKRNIQFVAT